MSAIMHIHKTGERCKRPKGFSGIKAENIQLGERLQIGRWELWYAVVHRCYIVCRVDLNGDHYEFHNFNCAAARLAEMGNK